MMSKSTVRAKAASIKASLDELEQAHAALPDSPETAAAKAAAARLHAKLNGAARRLAEIFEVDIETFSGGTDKPEED
jgi:hypothetical protein